MDSNDTLLLQKVYETYKSEWGGLTKPFITPPFQLECCLCKRSINVRKYDDFLLNK